MVFSDLGLGDQVLQAVTDAGYEKPTPIQAQAIPVVLMGRDMLGCAQTGTGKTASFTLPMIDILSQGKAKARMPRSLILEPTRELAAQVAENFNIYGKYTKLTKALLIGGESLDDQIRVVDRGVDVLIATPGRLMDLFDRGRLLLNDVKILVIDEADRMLDMGFIPDVERICGLLPRMRQTLLFSATMPPEIRRLADKFLMNPKEITVAPPSTTADTITQGLITVRHSDGKRPGGGQREKRAALRTLLKRENVRNALIFCNRKRDVSVVYRSLQRHGFNAAQLHGDMTQPARTETMARFKNGEFTLLVCSDVAARGLDIQGMSHVFNFDVPTHPEDYVHRIGRTGRAGREGHAFTIATPEDNKYIGAIERTIGKQIPRVSVDGARSRPASDALAAVAAEASAMPAAEGTSEPESTAAEPQGAEAAEQPAEDRGQNEHEPRERGRRRRRRGGRGRNRDREGGPEHAGPEHGRASGEALAASEGPEAAPSESHDAPEAVPILSEDSRPAPSEYDHRPRAEHGQRPRHRDERRDHRGGSGSNEPPVKGLGSHVPAFLLRDPGIPKEE